MLNWVKHEEKERGKVVSTRWHGADTDTEMIVYSVLKMATCDWCTLYDKRPPFRAGTHEIVGAFLTPEAAMKYADGLEQEAEEEMRNDPFFLCDIEDLPMGNTGAAEGRGCRPSAWARLRRFVTGEEK